MSQEGRTLSKDSQQALASQVGGRRVLLREFGRSTAFGSDLASRLRMGLKKSLERGSRGSRRQFQSSGSFQGTGKNRKGERWRWPRSERKKEVRGETDRNRQTEGGVPRAGRRAQASKPTSRRAPPGPRPVPHRPVDPFGLHKTSAPGVLARPLGLDSFLD